MARDIKKTLLKLVQEERLTIGYLKDRTDLLYPERDGDSKELTNLSCQGSDADFIELSISRFMDILEKAYIAGRSEK